MPKYKLHANYGFAGSQLVLDDCFEAENEDEAHDVAWQMAIERVDSWVEELEDDEDS